MANDEQQVNNQDTRNPHERGPLLTVKGQGLKRLVKASLAWLRHHREAINALNVFPVPDGDTGTNMLLTMQSAWAEIEHSPEDHIGKIAHAIAHGALMGARGNSGVILSQLWRGFARSLSGQATLTASGLVKAMQEGSDTAYKGVVKPVEGTILSVAREVAQACAEAARQTQDLVAILAHMVAQGKEAVARTPDQLPILKQAGVVDAGGQGYLVILEGMLRYLRGETVEIAEELAAAVDLPSQPRPIEAGDVEAGYNYDVQFIIVGRRLEVGPIREAITAMGSSALVVGDAEMIKVHIHVSDPGEPLSYAARLGSLRDVVVEDMQAQYQEFIMGRTKAPVIAPATPIEPGQVATVTVAPGEGLAHVFRSLGAGVVIPGGQTMNPSTEQFVQAIEALPTDQVVILPNNSNVVMTAQQAATLSTKQVRVVPTRTIPQGIAAQLAFSAQTDLLTNVQAMEQAVTQVQTGEVTMATRAVEMNGLRVQAGQVIGLLNDDLIAAGDTVEQVVWQLLDRMEIDSHEIVTMYYGDTVSAQQAEALAEAIRRRFPDQEVEVIEGGQPHYQYILSVE